MAKGKLPLIGLAAATVTLSACVVKVWEVTYPGPNDYYSRFFDITLDNQKKPVVTGYTQSEEGQTSLIVNHYQPDGRLTWNQTFPGYRHLSIGDFVKARAATDSDNNVIVSGFADSDTYSPLLFAKIGSDGDILWQQDIEAGDFIMPTDLAVTGNDTYLLLAGGVRAFSSEGAELWHYIPPTPCQSLECSSGEQGGDSGVNLDDYAQRAAAASAFAFTELAALDNGNIVFATSDVLYLLDADGNNTGEIHAASLGMDRFRDISHSGNQVVAIATNSVEATAFLFDSQLKHEILISDIPAGNERKVAITRGFICVAARNNDQLTVYTISDSVISNFSTQPGAAMFEMTDLNTDHSNNCYVSRFEYDDQSRVSVVTQILNNNAELTDTVTIRDFAGESVKVNGNAIYSAGITGGYEHIEGTRGTLFKHQVR